MKLATGIRKSPRLAQATNKCREAWPCVHAKYMYWPDRAARMFRAQRWRRGGKGGEWEGRMEGGQGRGEAGCVELAPARSLSFPPALSRPEAGQEPAHCLTARHPPPQPPSGSRRQVGGAGYGRCGVGGVGGRGGGGKRRSCSGPEPVRSRPAACNLPAAQQPVARHCERRAGRGAGRFGWRRMRGGGAPAPAEE
jgi:hypothetical protein